MKEIKVEELLNYFNPFVLEKEPAIALASNEKQSNGLTIGWASFGTLWRKPCATVYVHAKRYSKHIFDDAKYFAICFMKDEHKNVIKYFGSVSGRDEDKFKNCGLAINSNDVAPYFEESRLVVLCKIMGKSDFDANSVDEGVFDWYSKEGVHTQYYGEIIKVLVNE